MALSFYIKLHFRVDVFSALSFITGETYMDGCTCITTARSKEQIHVGEWNRYLSISSSMYKPIYWFWALTVFVEEKSISEGFSPAPRAVHHLVSSFVFISHLSQGMKPHKPRMWGVTCIISANRKPRCCVLPADVNECDLLSGVCGEALCENVEGSFLCMCPDEDQEYNQMTAKCSPAPTGDPHIAWTQMKSWYKAFQNSFKLELSKVVLR